MKKVIIFIFCLIILTACSSTYKIADQYKATYKTIDNKQTKK